MKVTLGPVEIPFENRHIGPSASEITEMCERIGVKDVSELIAQTIPADIKRAKNMDLPAPLTEEAFLAEFKAMMSQNVIAKNYIGMGYYGCITPKVILRNILENPGWYTAYTPYQAEIAQGRLEALINFQTTVIDLTGMEVANASLLDEGTAAAEAMSMLHQKRPRSKKAANTIVIDKYVLPQTLAVIEARAKAIGIDVQIKSLDEVDLTDDSIYTCLVQYPNSDGAVVDYSDFFAAAKENDVTVICAADLLALTALKSPGSMGADVVVGTTQRFGIPMGFGGPHAAYFATLEKYKRVMPGRIIGVSKDAHGNVAYRMALQTREQHIKREKATSNICTAQVLLAVMAGMYAVYHGPMGLQRIAHRVAGLTTVLGRELVKMGFEQVNDFFFDTIKVKVKDVKALAAKAEELKINLRYYDDGEHVGISLDETTTDADLEQLLRLFSAVAPQAVSDLSWQEEGYEVDIEWSESLVRQDSFMEHEVFHKYQSEHEMLRYLKRLENKDLSLTHSMISLGSCTMKLNATTEMIPVTWPELGGIHPFAPSSQVAGYHEMIEQLSVWLADITGFHGVSLQPNSGAQGEFAGLMVIKAYHEANGNAHRNVTLIPSSAHGTNPASAIMAGQQVVIVSCDERGNIDIDDLRAKAEEHADDLGALMITYPSTHGVFESAIKEICQIIHDHGGQVYMDGANMNAQVGLTSPGDIGADVCHLNLHKTFCIPHGGGGPGMGPICVAEHLTPYLPGHPVVDCGNYEAIEAISAAPYGSASILSISYAYIAMMGSRGLTRATEIAILNANYIKERLEQHYPILYSGENGRAAHEMIIDCRAFKEVKVEVADIAKRLMDYGYHAPTVSFPVAGTLMIEPTESETMEELDRFCDAMILIRKEIQAIMDGAADVENNLLKNAPHTADIVMADEWTLPYTRAEAAYPLPYVQHNKFWPSVSRIDNAYGDRNLMCSCVPVEEYMEEAAS